MGNAYFFEFVDFEDPALSFLDYAEYDTVTTPNFSGDLVSSYLKWKNVESYLHYFKQSFLTIKDKEVIFALCPDKFSVHSLVLLSDVI